MLQPNAHLQIPHLPGIVVYPDDRIPGGFYAFPDRPRIARDGTGVFKMNLLLYGATREGHFEPKGGTVSCTTSLGLRREEEEQLLTALDERLAAEPGKRPVRARLLALYWRKGRAALRLTRRLELSGRPSLFGGNDCVFQHSVDGLTARQLERSWADGLPDASASYTLTAAHGPVVTAAAGVHTDSHTVASETHGSTRRQHRRIRIRNDVGGSMVLTFEGPIEAAASELARTVEKVDLTVESEA